MSANLILNSPSQRPLTGNQKAQLLGRCTLLTSNGKGAHQGNLVLNRLQSAYRANNNVLRIEVARASNFFTPLSAGNKSLRIHTVTYSGYSSAIDTHFVLHILLDLPRQRDVMRDKR